MESDGLCADEIERYGRQLLLDELGCSGQVSLGRARVLVVGCGGLGSGCLPFLCSAGVGTLGLCDHDTVEKSNLHRQVLHGEKDVGRSKVVSAFETLTALNSSVKLLLHEERLTRKIAFLLVGDYDLVADCSDSSEVRYFLNDACCAAGVPLVACSALGWQGQLSVYNHKGGPCYRCVFPLPAPKEARGSCGETGVLGAVVGTMGAMQAMEIVKVLVGCGESLSGRLLVFDGLRAKQRVVQLRGKRADCAACGQNKQTKQQYDNEEEEEEGGCAVAVDSGALERGARECAVLLKEGALLVDVRPSSHFSFCRVAGSESAPLASLDEARCAQLRERSGGRGIVFVCRRGVDSLEAARRAVKDGDEVVVSMRGGLIAWSKQVDSTFPVY